MNKSILAVKVDDAILFISSMSMDCAIDILFEALKLKPKSTMRFKNRIDANENPIFPYLSAPITIIK